MKQREFDHIVKDLWEHELEFRKNPKNAHDLQVEQELFTELNALGYNFTWHLQLNAGAFTEKDKTVIPIFLKYLDEFENKNFKDKYLCCLGVKGFYDATEYLLNEYSTHLPPSYDGSWSLEAISQTIAKIQDPRFIDTYLSFLNDDKVVFETCHIVEMLGKMKVEKAIPYLIKLLDGERKTADNLYGTSLEDTKFFVSQESIKALAQFKNPEYMKYVEKFLEPEKISWIKYPDTKDGRNFLKSTHTKYRKIAKKAIEKMTLKPKTKR